MAKGEKISRALESLSEGLVRQADIGGVMYKEAATKEAARKAGELKQQERMWDLQIKIAGQTDRDYETVLEAVIDAEEALVGEDTVSESLMTRFREAEIRRNEAYAALGAIAPGGGRGKIQYAFQAGALDIISRNKSAVEDWKEMIAKGKTPSEFDTEIDEVLKRNYPDLVGNKEARSQFAEQLREALAAPSKPTSVIGMTDEELNPGLITQADRRPYIKRGGSRMGGIPSVDIPRAASDFMEWGAGKRPFGSRRSVKEDRRLPVSDEAKLLESEAVKRQEGKLSEQGAQYWKKYAALVPSKGKLDAMLGEDMREEFNNLSAEDQMVILQLYNVLFPQKEFLAQGME